jgi:hypothetical protein
MRLVAAFSVGFLTALLLTLAIVGRYSYQASAQGLLYRSDRWPPFRTTYSHFGSAWREVSDGAQKYNADGLEIVTPEK